MAGVGGVEASRQSKIGLLNLSGMALNVVGKKAEDRAEWDVPAQEGPTVQFLFGETAPAASSPLPSPSNL